MDVDLAKLLARHSSVAYTMNQRKLAAWACRRCKGPLAGSFKMMQVVDVPCKELMVCGGVGGWMGTVNGWMGGWIQ